LKRGTLREIIIIYFSFPRRISPSRAEAASLLTFLCYTQLDKHAW